MFFLIVRGDKSHYVSYLIIIILFFDSIEIPYGNTLAFGAFGECLSISHHEIKDEEEYNIIGRYV